jgi:hypothetical protein
VRRIDDARAYASDRTGLARDRTSELQSVEHALAATLVRAGGERHRERDAY